MGVKPFLHSYKVAELLAAGVAMFSGSDSARADANLILTYVLGTTREWLVAHNDAEVDEPSVKRFFQLAERRSKGEPVAYIIGSAWFLGHQFFVDNRVLVPRPETELLVEEATAFLRARDEVPANERRNVLDVGTGSGAIACAIAVTFPTVRVDAVDISRNALDVGRENARRLGVAERITFIEGDLTAPVSGRRYDAILANLPYVPSDEIALTPDPVSFEPHAALDGGPDGLDLYRRLLPSIPALAKPGALALFEAGPGLMDGLVKLASLSFPQASIHVRRDYAGHERYLSARFP